MIWLFYWSTALRSKVRNLQKNKLKKKPFWESKKFEEKIKKILEKSIPRKEKTVKILRKILEKNVQILRKRSKILTFNLRKLKPEFFSFFSPVVIIFFHILPNSINVKWYSSWFNFKKYSVITEAAVYSCFRGLLLGLLHFTITGPLRTFIIPKSKWVWHPCFRASTQREIVKKTLFGIDIYKNPFVSLCSTS